MILYMDYIDSSIFLAKENELNKFLIFTKSLSFLNKSI